MEQERAELLAGAGGCSVGWCSETQSGCIPPFSCELLSCVGKGLDPSSPSKGWAALSGAYTYPSTFL